jgi:EAL domain-containing protein (putative c-di-GMP-specific phosphodiesterase class I)
MRARPELGLDGEPELVFQPAVDLATGRLLGFEAFLRWNDPDLGPIPPSVLIPWAESNGHMVELNAWVLSEACAAAASWQADLQLAVNCSVFQLRQREAAAAAAAAIEESGLNPDRLTVEITETSVTDEGAAADLHAMSRLGIQLTVDDIGSDWSTIDNLQQFSINTMKIDGSLIEGLADEGGVSRAMVETIVHVSHSLGICTVAESVETAQQVKILRELGADVGQGYFFAKPLAVEDALMLTTMDPLPVFPLGDLGDEEFHNAAPRRSESAPESTDEESEPPAESEFTVAAEVIGALDEAGENAAAEPEREFVLTEDMHLEANDVSLVSKRGRLLASFRKGKPS